MHFHLFFRVYKNPVIRQLCSRWGSGSIMHNTGFVHSDCLLWLIPGVRDLRYCIHHHRASNKGWKLTACDRVWLTNLCCVSRATNHDWQLVESVLSWPLVTWSCQLLILSYSLRPDGYRRQCSNTQDVTVNFAFYILMWFHIFVDVEIIILLTC